MGIRSDTAVEDKLDELYGRKEESEDDLQVAKLKDKIEALEWVTGNNHEL